LRDAGGKKVSAARHSFEQLLIAVVEGAAQLDRALNEGIIGDKGVGPNGLHQFLFADESSGVLDEVFEGLIDLGAEFDLL